MTDVRRLRDQVDELVAETARAAACVGCLAAGEQDWCRLRLTWCPVLNRATTPDRRAQPRPRGHGLPRQDRRDT